MTTSPFEFVPDVRFAPSLQPDTSKFAKDFLVNGLYETLIEFRCGPFELDAHIEWFWREHRFWKATTFAEFVAVARKKIRDHVGYTRRFNEAASTVARLYDQAKYMAVEYDDVLKAITFLTPTKPMPNGVIENSSYAIVDVTLRESSPRVLRVERDFLPTLQAVYPWQRDGDRIVKEIPTAPRPLDLTTLAFWRLYPNAMTPQEIEEARVFRNGDRLDWTRDNLRSKWRDSAERKAQGVADEYREVRAADGSVRHFGQRNHVTLWTDPTPDD